MINKHKSNKIKENSNTVRHLNNGTDHRHSKSCCDQSSPARRTMIPNATIPIHFCLKIKCTSKFSHFDSIAVAIHESRGIANYGQFACSPHDCLLNCLFRRRSKKTSKLQVTGLCEGNSPVTDEFPSQRQVTRKMFPLDDVIMIVKMIAFVGTLLAIFFRNKHHYVCEMR